MLVTICFIWATTVRLSVKKYVWFLTYLLSGKNYGIHGELLIKIIDSLRIFQKKNMEISLLIVRKFKSFAHFFSKVGPVISSTFSRIFTGQSIRNDSRNFVINWSWISAWITLSVSISAKNRTKELPLLREVSPEADFRILSEFLLSFGRNFPIGRVGTSYALKV